MTPRLPPRLVALTSGALAQASEARLETEIRALALRVATARAHGLRGVLVREPDLGDRATLELAIALRKALGDDGWVGLHDRVHLAAAAGADAVHVGFRSLSPREARALVPAHIAVGFSAHAGDALPARAESDYLVLGPVFDTPSKRGWKEPLGVEGFARELARDTRPTWALGGVDASNAEALLTRGAAGVAVARALLGAAEGELAERTRALVLACERSSR